MCVSTFHSMVSGILQCIGAHKADRLKKVKNLRNIRISGGSVRRQEGNRSKHFTAVSRKWRQNDRKSFTPRMLYKFS